MPYHMYMQDLVMEECENHESEQKKRSADRGDDFSTRRMTPRSAYKQMILEDDFANLRITRPKIISCISYSTL